MNCGRAFAVRSVQEQIKHRATRVDFNLVVLTTVTVWINEHFEIIVVEDDLIMHSKRGPDVWLHEFRTDIEK